MERFAPWTPYPVRSQEGCLDCGSLDVGSVNNVIGGYRESSEGRCYDCHGTNTDSMPVCTGCCETQKRCECASECPCEEKGTLYDWEGHAVMACPVHPAQSV